MYRRGRGFKCSTFWASPQYKYPPYGVDASGSALLCKNRALWAAQVHSECRADAGE